VPFGLNSITEPKQGLEIEADTSKPLFADQDCATLAGNAALRVAHPQGNRSDSALYVSVSGMKLLGKSGSTLYYKVDINFDVSDGYSDSFPSETYTVFATGTEQACRVTGIRLTK